MNKLQFKVDENGILTEIECGSEHYDVSVSANGRLLLNGWEIKTIITEEFERRMKNCAELN